MDYGTKAKALMLQALTVYVAVNDEEAMLRDKLIPLIRAQVEAVIPKQPHEWVNPLTIEQFALLVGKEQMERYVEDWKEYDPTNKDHVGVIAHSCKTNIKPGKIYTKVDVGESGKFMIEIKTGIIYGIKAYGKVHKGHVYGTLSTTDEWFWGHYHPSKKVKVNHED